MRVPNEGPGASEAAPAKGYLTAPHRLAVTLLRHSGSKGGASGICFPQDEFSLREKARECLTGFFGVLAFFYLYTHH